MGVSFFTIVYLLRQLDPRHVLVDARQSAEFLAVVRHICGVANDTGAIDGGESAEGSGGNFKTAH